MADKPFIPRGKSKPVQPVEAPKPKKKSKAKKEKSED